MTPKEKAIELFDKYYELDFSTVWASKHRKLAKECSLIAVNEIIEATIDDWSHYEYWQEVKTELEKL